MAAAAGGSDHLAVEVAPLVAGRDVERGELGGLADVTGDVADDGDAIDADVLQYAARNEGRGGLGKLGQVARFGDLGDEADGAAGGVRQVDVLAGAEGLMMRHLKTIVALQLRGSAEITTQL
jgi:hypothetical protein